MNQKLSERSNRLILLSNLLVLSHILTPLLMFGSVIMWEEFNNILFLILGFLGCFVFGIMVLVIILQQPKCPYCEKSFFTKGDNIFNVGFSMYTRRCTNCKSSLNLK